MRGAGIRARVVATLVALVAVGAGLLVTGSATGAGAPGGGIYIALGDSYTSGPLVPVQHGDPIDCGRSDHNYPSVVAAALKPDKFIDVSCGSAETKHMTEPQTGLPAGGTNPPQFDALRADATLVTVGIGGNDAGLVGVAEKCATLGITDPNGTACRSNYNAGGSDEILQRIEDTRPKIDAVLQGIHERSPDARVAIVGYPDVLPTDGTNCFSPNVPLSKDDVAYIDGLIRAINSMIAEEAAANDAEFIDTYDDSRGHDVCKLPPNRWFEGLIPIEPAFPLHPNGKGEASMGRSAIATLSKPAPGDPPVRLTGLKVKPRKFDGGRVKVRFKLNRDARVLLTRRRDRPNGDKPKVRKLKLDPLPAAAGPNVFRIRAGKLGVRSGHYRLIASPTAPDGTNGVAAKTGYRVRP